MATLMRVNSRHSWRELIPLNIITTWTKWREKSNEGWARSSSNSWWLWSATNMILPSNYPNPDCFQLNIMTDHSSAFWWSKYVYCPLGNCPKPISPKCHTPAPYKQNSILGSEGKPIFFLEISSKYFPLLFICSLVKQVLTASHRIFLEHNNVHVTGILLLIKMPILSLIRLQLRAAIYWMRQWWRVAFPQRRKLKWWSWRHQCHNALENSLIQLIDWGCTRWWLSRCLHWWFGDTFDSWRLWWLSIWSRSSSLASSLRVRFPIR